MKIAIPDDYQDAVRMLDCFQKLNEQQVVISREHISDPEVLAARLQGVEVLVLIRERTPIIEALLARLPDLHLIVQTGKRAPHIDLAACTRHGVAVVYATPPHPGRPYATAELTWGLILAAMRFIPQEVASMKAGYWQRTLGRALSGRTLGIFGYGNIGSLIATYGQAFGMRVLAWGREGSRARAHADGIEVAASRDALFRDTDSFLRAEVLHPGELSPSVLHRVYGYASWWNNDASHSMPYSTGKPCLAQSLKPPVMETTSV